MTVHGQKHFQQDLKALIDRYCAEYLLTYAELVGILTIETRNLMVRGAAESDEPEDALE